MNQTFNVLFISPSLPPIHCGIGDYTHSLIKNLSKKNIYNLAVVTDIKADIDQSIDNIKVYSKMNNWKFSDLNRLIKILNDFKPDLIHIQHAPGTYHGGFLPYCLPAILFFRKLKIINTMHEGYTIRNIFKLFLLTTFSKEFISVRPNFRSNIHLLFRFLYSKKLFKFIPNASPFEDFKIVNYEISEKNKYLSNQKRLIVYFGFMFPHKGVDIIFEVADPNRDKILIIGPFDIKNRYHKKIYTESTSKKWLNKVDILGFVEKNEVAKILTLADAILLPIRSGSGIWNSSLHTAKLFRSFVLTTSLEKKGYHSDENTFYSNPDEVKEMKDALEKYSGKKNKNYPKNIWDDIISDHIKAYEKILLKK